MADIPGEIEATLVEMTTVDQAILGKSHTRREYLGALLDTAATAALTTFGATGVTHPFVVGTRSPVSSTEQARQAQKTAKTQETQQTQSFDTAEIINAREEQKAMQETYVINTPERQELRKQVADTLLNRGSFVEKGQEGKDVFSGHVENNKIAHIVIGLPASGKSSFVNILSKEGKALIIDADEAKPFLGDIKHSGATHKESGDIIDTIITPEAMKQGKNIILSL